ncbi:MAG: hypothetical protein AUK47_16325 [Deltaproteobacteria bacterium CG2_30_63_29]|nr:MAG: hypothetical protein AUK47_16325 [Deltaproteobacteria bacterium CG2_30_63_29]PJB34707.1 MAG: NADH-quinone oxidoreductase subunit C [Deltaproteobacteria bacterium CG_4_9_14_3_um_filter_63_12]
MSKKALNRVKKQFKKQLIDTHSQCGDETIIVGRESLHEVVAFLKTDAETSFDMLSDVTAVDWLGVRDDYRFEVVYHFLSLSLRQRMRVKVPLTDADPTIDSISDLYHSANWAEREVFDMYGIRFNGHPDPRRMLLYEEFEGHPLRKDYSILASQPRIDLLDVERPTTNLYQPNYGEYGLAKEVH